MELPELSELADKLPYVNWLYFFRVSFWQSYQNIVNVYIYFALVALPCTFIWMFFATQQDDKRVKEALKWCFNVVVFILPITLFTLFAVINIYQEIVRRINSL